MFLFSLKCMSKKEKKNITVGLKELALQFLAFGCMVDVWVWIQLYNVWWELGASEFMHSIFLPSSYDCQRCHIY